MIVQPATISDLPLIIALFQQTVQATTYGYDERQRTAWATRGSNSTRWEQRIANQYFLVAVVESDLQGFGSITCSGYLDVLFVHPAYQRQGIATNLLTALEAWATQQRAETVVTNASITARPFFEHHGYRVITEQQNKIANEILINYRMQKNL